MSERKQTLYLEWNSWTDYLWLAHDRRNHVAAVSCAVALGLPSWITVKEHLFDELEERIIQSLAVCSEIDVPTDQVINMEYYKRPSLPRLVRNYFSQTASKENQVSKYIDYFRSFALRGLYYYDYTATRSHCCFYECRAAPVTPIKICDLPDDLRELAEYFFVSEKEFSALTPKDVECYEKHKMRPFYQHPYQPRSILPEDFHAGSVLR